MGTLEINRSGAILTMPAKPFLGSLLLAELVAAGISVDEPYLSPSGISFSFPGRTEPLSAQDQATLEGVLAAHVVPTPPTLREQATSTFQDTQAPPAVVKRAIVLSAMDSDNVLRKFTRDLLTQIAAATNLADLKTRCANNLPVLAALDGADAKAAIAAKIDGGGAD